MSQHAVESIRTIAFVGHGGAGKTTLAEALLYGAGAIKSKGAIEKGSTVCDFDPQEKTYGHSLQSAIVHFEHNNVRIHLIDAPGYPDFAGQAIAALEAIDTVFVVINAQTGIELMTERMLRWAKERKLCTMIVINKIDAPNLDLPSLVAELRTKFNGMVLDLPTHGAKDVVEVLAHDSGETDFGSVAEAHGQLIERIVEEDLVLLEKYLEAGEEPKLTDIHSSFESALRAGFVPILFTSAKTGAGVDELLNVIANLAPNPSEGNIPPFYKAQPGGSTEAIQAIPDPEKHVLAHVFKVISDPHMGKVGVFRVHQGTVKQGMPLFIGDGKRQFRAMHLYQLHGKDFQEVNALIPGDIGAVVKADEIMFDAVLHDSHDEDYIYLKPMNFPQSMSGLSVETKRKGDEQRLFDILDKLALEDPTFIVERRPATNETVILGLGDAHLKAKLEKMVSQYKLEVDTKPPLIPYRETISLSAEGHYRHKKQTGGAGQFGEVFLRIEPLERGKGIEFVDAVKGGAIPGVFIPAVEKGVRQALEGGVLAGFPVTDLRVTVFDGKTHTVDSKEVAFVTAGRKAVIESIRLARPLVLEPIVDIEIISPEAAIGDIVGDLSFKRGHITGTDPGSQGQIIIKGKVPLGELTDYQSRLNALTSGRGHYTIALSHYEALPLNIQQQLAGKFKLIEDDE